MKVFHFTEQAYFPTWNDHNGSLRVNLPNIKCDPKIAADNYHRYYDEWVLADELGFDIMVNEHHQTATCTSSACIVTLSILARETKRARLLVLGYPIGHRPDPLKVVEELSIIDVVSRGRLEMGFVKGVPYEVPVANTNPVFLMDRFWEAHDFILKAMTSHGEPFNWEGEHFHYRHVNVWPRPWQQPHPPVWITTSSATQARNLGERGYVMATLGSGYATKGLYDAYRQGYMLKRGTAPGADRFAYLGLVAVARDEAEARRRAELVAGYVRTSSIVHPPFRNPPGFISADDNAKLLKAGKPPARTFTKDGRPVDMRTGSVQELIDSAIMFAGTPDQVYQQLVDFCDWVGGMGNLLMMAQAGYLTHEDTVDSLTLFAKEVLPRLKEYKQPGAAAAA